MKKWSRQWRGTPGTIYLLHFTRPHHHTQHYVGFSQNLDERIADHRRGQGAKIMAAVVAAGIDFVVARTWIGDLWDERRMHRWKNHRRLCPICNPRLAALDKTNGPRSDHEAPRRV